MGAIPRRSVVAPLCAEWAAINAIATKLGIGSTEIRRLRAENRELRRSNEILWAAAAHFFAADLDRPQR